MQTDEYEISLSREIALCRKMVRRLQDSLAKRENHVEPDWQREYQELQFWQKMLGEYESALQSLRVS